MTGRMCNIIEQVDITISKNQVLQILSQPKHPWCKKVVAKNLKKAGMKKMWNRIGRPRPPAVDEIKIFDNDDKATKH